MPVTADTVNELTSPAATATLRASRTLLLSAPWLRPSGLLFSPGGTDVQGRFWAVFTIEFGPGVGILSFRDPASPPTPGSVFANQTSFAHLQEPWDFLRCCVLRILSNERNRICLLPPPPLGLSGPRLSASSSSPRLLFNLVMRNFATLANNRYSMTLQLRDRRDKSASLESSPNAPELFRASWVRGGIAKILPNRTMNAVLVQGLLWDGF